ncbi:hypothetical protein BDB01DRAFT_743993 [Pilobolus umbonatus]|nr:hypothetical protein BDB01DRAFT_743993 [Pilobolus umbonatus]
MSHEHTHSNQFSMNTNNSLSPLHHSNDKKCEEGTDTKCMPPVKRLPLRKRLALEGSNKVFKKQATESSLVGEHPMHSMDTQSNVEDKTVSIEYPLTPNSHTSSSDTTSVNHNNPSPKTDETLSEGETTETDEEHVPFSTANTLKNVPDQASINHTKKPEMKVKLIGNPLLLNNGMTKKSPAESTIDAFRAAWLKEDKTIIAKKAKRGRPPLSAKNRTPGTTDKSPRKTMNGYNIPSHNRKRSNSGKGRGGKLYCICRQPYNSTRFMIACDQCDEWFHGECIDISEKESEFVDSYFCEKCSEASGKKTSWKPKCANPACLKAARIGSHLGYLSKYCSDSCGMQVARARLELAEIKRRASSSDTSVSIADLALKNQQHLRVNSFADKDDRAKLYQLKESIDEIRVKIDATRCKEKFCRLLLRLDEEKKASDKYKPCGFDSRLIWPDSVWLQVKEEPYLVNGEVLVDLDGAEQYTVCKAMKCSKHSNWQAIMMSDIEHEKHEECGSLMRLESERSQIRARLRKRRDRVELLHSLSNNTIVYE